jgi:hypothetical protein
VKTFDLAITAPNAPILERIEQLNAYQPMSQQKYYEADFVSHPQMTQFKITQRRRDRPDRDVTIIGSIVDDADQSTHVIAKIFPSTMNTLFTSLMTVVALMVLMWSFTQLVPEQLLILASVTLLLVIFSLFQWIGVATHRLSFDQFLQDWLTTESSIQ